MSFDHKHHYVCRQQDAISSGDDRYRKPEYDFVGPWLGPLGIMLGLPAVCYALVYVCNAGGKPLHGNVSPTKAAVLPSNNAETSFLNWCSNKATHHRGKRLERRTLSGILTALRVLQQAI